MTSIVTTQLRMGHIALTTSSISFLSLLYFLMYLTTVRLIFTVQSQSNERIAIARRKTCIFRLSTGSSRYVDVTPLFGCSPFSLLTPNY